MKKIVSSLFILIVLQSFTSFADDKPAKLVHDNNRGQSAKITFTAEVVKLLTIESNVLVLNIGPLAEGETKILGSDFNAVFHLNGVPNAKFVINLVDESVKNNSVTLNGVNWSFRNSTLVDYTEILSFPYISELNSTSGDGWLKVFPASIKANHSIESKTVYFEFKFNCSYYEL